MVSTLEKYCKMMIYGTLGTACILALIAALGMPDEIDVSEAQIAALYLAILIGSNKAFNAKPVFGSRILGAIAAFTGTGLLPATIIHVALAQIEPGQSAHLETLKSFGIVTAGTAFIIAVFVFIPPFSLISNMIWRAYHEQSESSQ